MILPFESSFAVPEFPAHCSMRVRFPQAPPWVRFTEPGNCGIPQMPRQAMVEVESGIRAVNRRVVGNSEVEPRPSGGIKRRFAGYPLITGERHDIYEQLCTSRFSASAAVSA